MLATQKARYILILREVISMSVSSRISIILSAFLFLPLTIYNNKFMPRKPVYRAGKQSLDVLARPLHAKDAENSVLQTSVILSRDPCSYYVPHCRRGMAAGDAHVSRKCKKGKVANKCSHDSTDSERGIIYPSNAHEKRTITSRDTRVLPYPSSEF